MSKENQKNMSCRKAVIRHLRISVSDGMVNERKEIRRSRIKCGMTPHFMGFTLIELLVVVLIIGILAAVALPQYQKSVTKSRAIQLITMVLKTRQAQENFYLANGYYTRNWEELPLDFPGTLNAARDKITSTAGWSLKLELVQSNGWGNLVRATDSRLQNIDIIAAYNNGNGSWWKGRMVCRADETYTKANKRCQDITNQKTSISGGNNQNYYTFQN